MSVSAALQLTGAALTFAGGWPQTWRVVRGSTHGVSALTWASLAGTGLLWTMWGVGAGVPLMAASEGVFAAAAAAVAWRCWGASKSVVVAIAAFAFCAGLGLLWGATGLGVAGVVACIGCRAPQLWRSWFCGDVSGVSASSWWLLTWSNLAWTVSGVLTSDWILVAGSGSAVAMSLLIVAATHLPRRPEAVPA